jgi:hypothetical protein
MDPLSILGIATAAVQFLDFGLKGCHWVLGLYSDYKDEAAIGQAPFKATAADLVRFSKQCDSGWMLVSSNYPNASEEIQEVG